MSNLTPVDGVDVHVLVDNVTDNLSSVPVFVETEWAALTRKRRGAWVDSGTCLCCAAHGLSCLITVRQGTETRTFLFDSGPEDRTFEQNVSRLGADLGSVEAIVLSHGHWDHGGAMLRALQLIRDRNGGREVAYYSHPDMFRTRALKQADGGMLSLEDVPSIDSLTAHGGKVVNTTEAQLIVNGMAQPGSSCILRYDMSPTGPVTTKVQTDPHPAKSILEQPYRAGSPADQAARQADAWFQIIRKCRSYPVRHRAGSYDA